jgi:hypothetical protein
MMLAFDKAAQNNFEDRMALHVRQFFPESFNRMGEVQTREFIAYGIERAATFAITLEPDVCKYIDVMVTFGRDFDVDPSCSWATAILYEDEFPNPTERVIELYYRALDHAS